MAKTYVPGYGYVDSSGPGTTGSLPGFGSGNNGSGGVPDFTVDESGATKSDSARPGSVSANVGSGDRYVPYPNLDFYYSSADAYMQAPGPDGTYQMPANPADPQFNAWNFGLSKTDAYGKYDSLPQNVKDILQAIATKEWPTKKGASVWSELVDASYAANATGENVTPFSMLNSRIQSTFGNGNPDTNGSGPSGSGPSGGGSYGGGGGSATSERIDLTSYTGAQTLLTQYMQATVGRNPKPGETEKFMELLQGYQTNNPMTATASGNSVTQSGGVDPNAVAQTFVEGLPDYREAQGERYYRAFMSALVGGGA